MIRVPRTLLTIISALVPSSALAELPGPYLLKDIYPGQQGGIPDYSRPRVVGNTMIFAASDGSTGYELWKSDGTTQGTVLLKDIRSGSGSSNPSVRLADNGTLYFRAENQSSSSYDQFWKTDGTAGGTAIAASIPSGGGFDSNPTPHLSVGNTLYFSAYTNAAGYELWKIAGSAGAPEMVADIFPGYKGSGPSAGVAMGNIYYFSAVHPTLGRELWRTDGTSSGTSLVRDIAAGAPASAPSQITSAGGFLYFIADDGVHGAELWRSNGTTEGTFMVKDIAPGMEAGPYPGSLTLAGGLAFFSARTVPDSSHWALWRSDGTSVGTFPLLALDTAISVRMQTAGNDLLFVPSVAGETKQVWKSNGTIAGTTPLKPGVKTQVDFVLPNGNGFYFGSSRAGTLWQSDGTADGVHAVADLFASISGSYIGTALPVMVGEKICFIASSPGVGYEMWGYDTALPSVARPLPYALTKTSARLELAVNPNGTSTSAKLEYGPSSAYGTTVDLPMPSGNAGKLFQRFDIPLAGITGGTTYYYRLTATSSKGTRAATGSFVAPLVSLPDWRLARFGTSENTGLAADDQDPDRDGVSNLLEYAFGLDPFIADAGGLPQAQPAGYGFGCQFTQPAGIADIIYGAEWSRTLEPGSWSIVSDGGSGDVHRFHVSAYLGPKVFMRFTATRRP